MKTRRFLAIIMAIVMVFAMCSCASAEPEKKDEPATKVETEKDDADAVAKVESEKDDAEEAAETEETEEAEKPVDVSDDEENDLGLTGSEMKEIYAAIEEDLQKEYLDVNNIKVEDFSIPTDDESWDYFVNSCTEIVVVHDFDVSKEEVQNRISQMVPLSEENQKIMTIISYSFSNSLKEFEKDFLIVDFFIDDSLIDLCQELITSNVFATSEVDQ